ncbi:MAG TPA: aldose 1-epimerase family protein, partial [Cytophagales bacterium]|nr:aldose 1-epimerase family protein [Cytophagales bacterium]
MTAVHIIENEYLKVVVSELGAELQSIINKKNNKEYLWQGSKEIWPRKAPVLFPIVGKVFNDTYYHEGKSYKLTQHGFARDEAFDMLMSGSQQLTFLLTENATTLEKYPFPFNLYIGYTLDGPKIKVLYEVQNTGETDMYFSIGGHPGFNCPLEGKGTYEDYFLELPQETLEIFPLQEGGYQAGTKTTLSTLGRKLNLSKNLFKNDALVFKNGEVTQVRLWNKDRNEGIGLS